MFVFVRRTVLVLATVLAAFSVGIAAPAQAAAASCQRDFVCVWTGRDFTGEKRSIPVRYLYDCASVSYGARQSIYNNTRFAFDLHTRWGKDYARIGTAAPFKAYARVGGGPLTWFDLINSPGCPI